MTTIVYAIHSIQMRGRHVEPGTLIEVDDETLADLSRFEAIRDASPAEVGVYRLTNPAAEEPAPVAPVEPSPEADSREALEEEARALGVKFNRNLSDEKLRERIAEARVAASVEGDPDVQMPPEGFDF